MLSIAYLFLPASFSFLWIVAWPSTKQGGRGSNERHWKSTVIQPSSGGSERPCHYPNIITALRLGFWLFFFCVFPSLVGFFVIRYKLLGGKTLVSVKLCSAWKISIWLPSHLWLKFSFFLEYVCAGESPLAIYSWHASRIKASCSLAKGNDVSGVEMKHTDGHTLR